jgi:hypothetical protein
MVSQRDRPANIHVDEDKQTDEETDEQMDGHSDGK